jgi:hypothetical protein
MIYSFQLDEIAILYAVSKVSITGLGTLAVSAIILELLHFVDRASRYDSW